MTEYAAATSARSGTFARDAECTASGRRRRGCAQIWGIDWARSSAFAHSGVVMVVVVVVMIIVV